uniref:Uncharacterized protein n=1 Tax=Peronospora matthiolae TaxID=2874970 RepID=A0AAV1U3H6_9STRA
MHPRQRSLHRRTQSQHRLSSPILQILHLLVNAGEAAVTTRSTISPVESAPVTLYVRSPLVVTAIRAAPADVDSPPPKDFVDSRPPMNAPPVEVVVLCCRVEACKGRLALMSTLPQYWSLRCEHLEGRSGDSSALVSLLSKKLQYEMALTDHWRNQVDLSNSRTSLLSWQRSDTLILRVNL